MTDLAEQLFREIHAIMSSEGEADAALATYTPATGAAKTNVRIMIEKGFALFPSGFMTQVTGQSITVEAALSDLGKEPDRGETFTLTTGGTVYTVLSVVENDGHTIKVLVR